MFRNILITSAYQIDTYDKMGGVSLIFAIGFDQWMLYVYSNIPPKQNSVFQVIHFGLV
jgi:hypothetical protein